MKGRSYYFCSKGSIYTVTPATRKGGKRMGKYMKKAKSVKNMEVSQSSLLGVRTRARALALDKQTSESICKHSSGKPRRTSESYRIPLKSEPHYMQLRSRTLEKEEKHRRIEKNSAEDEQNELKLEFTGGRVTDHASTIVFPSSCTPNVDFLLHNEELQILPARNSCSSRPDFTLVGICSTTAPDIEDASHSRVASPAQSCLHASCSTSNTAVSTPTSTMRRRGTSPQMITRLRHQELDAEVINTKVTNESYKLVARSVSGNLQRHMKIGPCFGDSPTLVGPSSGERHEGPNSHRQQRQECSLENLSEVPVSLRRSCEETFSSEVEAFFAVAEQNERRRFINGYNFDPLTEMPLKGRYLWLKE